MTATRELTYITGRSRVPHVGELAVVFAGTPLEEFRRDLAVEDEVAMVQLNACGSPFTQWLHSGKKVGSPEE